MLPLSSAAEPHLIALSGRRRPFRICHAPIALCPRCLWAIARFLAEECGWDGRAALNRPTEAYLAEIDATVSTMEQARELRRMTCLWCWLEPRRELGNMQAPEMMIADFDLPAEAPLRRLGIFTLLKVACVLGYAVVSLVGVF